MAHIQSKYSGLWKPQDLSTDKINSQMMFVDNIDAMEAFTLSVLKTVHTSVASITDLKAIDTSDITRFVDNMTIVVKSKGIYFFDRGSTATDDGDKIIAPTVGGGRWISDKSFFGSLAFKDSLTKSDIGLGNVPNVATNDQTPTFTQVSSLTNLISGEKLSVSMGKIMKAITDLIAHLANNNNPHKVTKSQVGLDKVDNTSDADKPVSTAQALAISDAKGAGTSAQTNLASHIANEDNPHKVTKGQVGLGNVPNVTTNDQAPTFTQAGSLVNVVSGEKLSVSMGKIMKAITDLIAHFSNENNPHKVTKSQVGLGNVPNVATNDQTPTFTTATTLAALSSGEKLSVSMGKIAKAIADLGTHLSNKNNPHAVTKAQVGLDKVDNTADKDKPISTAVQAALDNKATVYEGEIATASYLRLTGFAILEGKNLNDCKYSGQYGVMSTCTNRPSNDQSYGILEVVMYSSHWLIQRYYAMDNLGNLFGVWYRTYYADSAWTSWKLYNMNNSATVVAATVE